MEQESKEREWAHTHTHTHTVFDSQHTRRASPAAGAVSPFSLPHISNGQKRPSTMLVVKNDVVYELQCLKVTEYWSTGPVAVTCPEFLPVCHTHTYTHTHTQ